MLFSTVFVKSTIKNKYRKIILIVLAVNLISIAWNQAYIIYGFPKNIFLRGIPAIINPFSIASKNGGLPLTFLECIELSVAVLLYSTPYILLTGYFLVLDSKIAKFFGILLSLLYFTVGIKVLLK